ncbi:MAG: PAS domain-containing protein [Candidatus Didemnitutus sp.]|nr:PAS domain-containing protein [Candidatus Didemnitutus sp.]
MNVRPVTPLGIAREFKLNEMFFSTTDARGVIVNGNEVFTRVSGFTTEELVGHAHNIIRHPHMPRAAFQLVWENLKAGRSFAGYVKNMAKDGAYYWVFAVIVPISGGRFLSIRFKPTSPTFAVVERLYEKLARTESVAIAGGAAPKEAMEKSRAQLGEELRALGFASYDLFSHVALNAELCERDSRLEAAKLGLFPSAIHGQGISASVAQLYDDGLRVYRQVTEVFAELHRFIRFHEQLQNAGRSVLGVADDFRMHALNVNITAQRHGLEGRTVGVVATFLDHYAQELGRGTHELRSHVTRTSAATESINADIAIARLQMEMILAYQAELALGTGAAKDKSSMLIDLEEAFVDRTRAAARSITELQTESALLAESREQLSKVAMSIQMAQVRGLTEAARIAEAENLRTMFADFRHKIDETNKELVALDDALNYLGMLTAQTPRQIMAVGLAAENIQERVRALAAA